MKVYIYRRAGARLLSRFHSGRILSTACPGKEKSSLPTGKMIQFYFALFVVHLLKVQDETCDGEIVDPVIKYG